MKPHKHCELIKAWADGAEIQYFDSGVDRWIDNPDPQFKPVSSYRVKPDRKKYRVAKFNNPYELTNTADNDTHIAIFESSPTFIEWLTDWIEYD